MSEEKRMPVLTGQKKQIFYTGLVYLLVCFMTAGVTVFLTKEKKDEVKEVSAVVTEEPKVNTGYAAMETNPLLEFTLKYRDLKPYMRSRTKMENSIFRQRSLTSRFRR